MLSTTIWWRSYWAKPSKKLNALSIMCTVSLSVYDRWVWVQVGVCVVGGLAFLISNHLWLSMIVTPWCPICASWHGWRGRSLSFSAHQRSSSWSAAPTRTPSCFPHVVLFWAMSSQLLLMMWSFLRLLAKLFLYIFFWLPGACWPACNWEICLRRRESSILTTWPVHLS